MIQLKYDKYEKPINLINWSIFFLNATISWLNARTTGADSRVNHSCKAVQIPVSPFMISWFMRTVNYIHDTYIYIYYVYLCVCEYVWKRYIPKTLL